MAFDMSTFVQSGGNLQGLASSFGVPSCMVGLGQDLIGLIPSPILLAMREAQMAARRKLDAILKRIQADIRDFLGISMWPDRDGFFAYFSEYSRYGLDVLAGVTGLIGEFLALIQAGGALIAAAQDKYNEILSCLGKFKQALDYSNGDAAARREELANASPEKFQSIIDSQLGIYLEQARIAQTRLDALDASIAEIDELLLQRNLDPSLEPGFEESEVEEAIESVFRLEAGPPKASSGKFVLSIDGLYYDSQTSGTQPALLEIEERSEEAKFKDGVRNKDYWKLQHDPNIGGRGLPTTEKDLQFYFNSVLDPDIIDNSEGLVNFYNSDDLLLSLQGQKDRRVFDLSGQLEDSIAAGESEAIADNLRQVILSEASHFQDKINKRKKQIEIAVKVPAFLGNGAQFSPGEIPVNDFSYLAGTNFLVDVENQRKITLRQDDVSSVVLPLETKYTEKIETTDRVVLNHILLANVAKGEVISDSSSVSASPLQVSDRITQEGLIGLYNYLSVKTDEASGTNFACHNSSNFGTDYNAQMVGAASEIFKAGIGVPFLSGVVIPAYGANVQATGTYLRVPERNEFQDFLYNPEGGSFETWIHMPHLNNATSGYNQYDDNVLGLYRLILANENVGLSESKEKQASIDNLSPDFGTGIVRGFICGFTRDRRFTLNLPPSNDSALNVMDDVSLLIAPTQSYDQSSIGFLSKRDVNCQSDSYRGMVIPVSSTFNGATLSSCADSFCQLSVSLDPRKDTVSVYLDGQSLATSSYRDVFGTSRVGETYKAPSVAQTNSFQYSSGPSLDTYFTPWIVGGGYTDGFEENNFMGGEYGGRVSGLRGYLGCTRFYSKPLSDGDVLNNYNATQNFFKNIDVGDL